MSNRILVTGGLGFLGQHLVSELSKEYPNSEIVILARSKRKIFINSLIQNKKLTIHYNIDLLDTNTYEKHFNNIDIVFHCAAHISFWKKDRDILFETNINGTKNIISVCKKNKIDKFIYISSTAALGYNNDKDNPIDESYLFNWKKAKKCSYMLSKYHGEQVVLQEIKKGFKAMIASPSTITGPGDKNMFPLIGNLKEGKLPFIMPGGFALIDVRDLAKGIVALSQKGKIGENYLFTGGNYLIKDIIYNISDKLKVDPPKKTFPLFFGGLLTGIISIMENKSKTTPKLTYEIVSGSLKYRYYSSKKAKENLAWTPEIKVEQTLSDVINEYLKEEVKI